MANINEEIAAATFAVGTDVISGFPLRQMPRFRRLEGIALTGSTAVGDCHGELMVNNVSFGKFENTSTGLAVDMSKDFKKVQAKVYANQTVQFIVRDAAVANPVRLFIMFTEWTGNRGSRKYLRYGRRSYGGRVTGGRIGGGMY